MPHSTKKQRIEGNRTIVDDFLASFGDLSVDVLANIFGFLEVKNIMRSRRINKKTMEAVKMTIVPLSKGILSYLRVYNTRTYNAMGVMTRAMPNLQQIAIGYLGRLHKYSDGEDPDEGEAARYANWTPHDIEIISNFRHLSILEIFTYAGLNGRYSVFFNSFPLLQKLRIHHCHNLKWDLEMLAGFPLLKELDCEYNFRLTGNINSLRVLKDTLEVVNINVCRRVEGNFMDLADFPHLKKLKLDDTAVTGDIRDIGDNDFPSLITLILPKTVYRGRGSKFQRISNGPKLIKELYPLKKHHPRLSVLRDWYGMLSRDSPDWYASMNGKNPPPLYIRFVEAGSRIGYQWLSMSFSTSNPCEVNWLDPEPDRESSDYGKYIEELQVINSQFTFFRGFHQPPTEEEYHRLFEDYAERHETREE
jgi:hypothetical protein